MIRKTSLFVAMVFAATSSVAIGEETGTGKPENSTNSSTTTTTTTTNSTAMVECGWIQTWLGTCENNSDTTSE